MFKKLLIFLITLVAFLTFASLSFASTLYLSPGSANIPQGTIRSVSIGINTAGESVNGVSAYLSYPADKLEVAWISYGSRFDLAAEGTYGGGSIRISRGSISGVVGNVNLATIGFKGKSLGTATVAFIGGSAAPRSSDSSDSLNLGGSTGGTFTIGEPLKVTPTATDTAKPIISNIKTTNISTNSATVVWETDEMSDSTLEYGLTPNKYFLTIFDKTLAATHSAKLEGEPLTPGAIFHFRVKSKDKFNNEGISKDSNFQLIGHNISIKALDTKSNPLKDSEVLLYNSQKARTNTNGEVSFANVTEGKHLVVVKAGLIEKTGEIDVSSSFALQSFTLTLDLDSTGTLFSNPYIMALAISIIGIAIVLIIIMLLKRRKNNIADEVPSQPSTPNESSQNSA